MSSWGTSSSGLFRRMPARSWSAMSISFPRSALAQSFSDLIVSEAVTVVHSRKIFRQAAESQIITAAYAINQGRMPDLKTPEGLGDFYFSRPPTPRRSRTWWYAVKERIPGRFGVDPKADIQVLSP